MGHFPSFLQAIFSLLFCLQHSSMKGECVLTLAARVEKLTSIETRVSNSPLLKGSMA